MCQHPEMLIHSVSDRIETIHTDALERQLARQAMDLRLTAPRVWDGLRHVCSRMLRLQFH
ncbi:hypothetical protein [Deinococcus sonorensis]|uniref:Uncharacterized protein n=2 Tax=Deinococcus sonorensis TaxID=309891 RepID=A0ABV8Y466_9DEIO